MRNTMLINHEWDMDQRRSLKRKRMAFLCKRAAAPGQAGGSSNVGATPKVKCLPDTRTVVSLQLVKVEDLRLFRLYIYRSVSCSLFLKYSQQTCSKQKRNFTHL